jgi:nucleoside-diphosphate-sugar epimerase
MKALITGCDGFVGRHFTRYLKEMDWDVYGLDIASDPTEDAFRYFVDGYDEWFDLIVHSAYEVGGRAHIDGTNMALAHNVAMDASMFDWALKSRQGAVLYFSSSAAYPTYLQGKDRIKLREDDLNLSYPVRPDANYGWAKLTGEKVAQDASEQGLRVHVVRPFSGCAVDQSLAYPWPSIARRAQKQEYSVWGEKGQTRDWIHIDDVVAGAFAVYEADERRPVNLCTGVATEMGELMTMFAKAFHGVSATVTYQTDRPTGVHYRVGDPTRMLEHYIPEYDVERLIDETVLHLSS